ncbi:MAG: hypothetical protein KAI66_08180 [Lentisphaeria bacterium]|nr:hypothetical protein [Lentisphaeria bacterium]
MMEWKKNWREVRDRYRAFWRDEPLDRPPVLFDSIGSLRHPMYRGAGYDYTKYGEDIDALCRDYGRIWEARVDVPDDTVPCIAPQMGGAIEPALLSGSIEWGTELSVLTPHNPLANCTDLRMVKFRRDNPYFQRIRRELERLAHVSQGRFGINVEAGMSLTSTMSLLRGGTQFMFDVIDRPDEIRALAETVLKALLAVQAEVIRLNPLSDGTAHRWLNYWHPGTGFWFSEDDAVMLSPEMYRDLFLDLDIRLCAGVDVAVAHWHTAGLHLLPTLMEIPNLRMVQISFDPNGPDLDAVLNACRPVVEAGRKICFQTGYSREFVEHVFRLLPPKACMFYFAYAKDAAEVERILAELTRLARHSGTKGKRA